MSITATVENGMVKLPMPVPDGTQVEITLPERLEELGQNEEPLGWMQEFAGCIDTLPPDAAERHNEYRSAQKRQPLE